MAGMAATDIDDYLAGVEVPKRAVLEQLRLDILSVAPDAEQCMSYGVPAFKVDGKAVAGFAAFKDHLSYLPHSGSVIGVLEAELAAYKRSKGSLRFTIDQTIPPALVAKLIKARLAELGNAV